MPEAIFEDKKTEREAKYNKFMFGKQKCKYLN